MSKTLIEKPRVLHLLLFRKDEIVYPTKTNHSEMNPDHLKLVVDECSQFLSQDLIEATTSS